MKFSNFFTIKEIDQVHEASLKILAEVGILVRSEKARSIFSRHGCKVDASSMIVKLPTGIVDEFQAGFSPSFTFRGRDPQFDRTIPDDQPFTALQRTAVKVPFSKPQKWILIPRWPPRLSRDLLLIKYMS